MTLIEHFLTKNIQIGEFFILKINTHYAKVYEDDQIEIKDLLRRTKDFS